jgi:DNA mismatch repair protein MutL
MMVFIETEHNLVIFILNGAPTIDINIHPTKTEIKFDDEHALYAILRASIKHSLGQFNVLQFWISTEMLI